MKAKLTTVLAVTFAAVTLTAVFAASASATQLIVNSMHAVTADKIAESHADLSGSNLVWQQKTGSDWNIYYAAGLLGPGTSICSAAGDQIKPRVSQTDPGQPDNHVLVVWEDHRSGNADIQGYDVTTSTAFSVCTNTAQQTAPRISGDWVVWQDQRSGDWAVWGAHIDPATDTVGPAAPISPEPSAGSDETEPDVSGDYVVWVDNRYGDDDIFAYDSAAGYTWDVYPDTQRADQDQPSVSGHTVVWRDAGGVATTGTDILGADLLTGVPFVVCQAAGDQSWPAIDQDLVVWTDARSVAHSLDVRGFDLTLKQRFPVAVTTARQCQPTISDYQVVWTDNRNHAINDLWKAAFTPWNASIMIDDGLTWTRTRDATAELSLFAQGKTGEVTSMALGNVDAGGQTGVPEPYATVRSRGLDERGRAQDRRGRVHRSLGRIVAEDVRLDHRRHTRSDHQGAGGGRSRAAIPRRSAFAWATTSRRGRPSSSVCSTRRATSSRSLWPVRSVPARPCTTGSSSARSSRARTRYGPGRPTWPAIRR